MKKELNGAYNGILSIDSFDGSGRSPRKEQQECLEYLQMNWNTHRIFPLSLPTGAGKSAIAMSILRGCKHNQVVIVCPNNALVMQYVKEYPDVPYLIGKDAMGACKKCKGAKCPSPCIWRINKEKVRKGYSFITNGAWLTQQTIMAHGMELKPCVVILDECDQILHYARSKGDVEIDGVVTDNPFELLSKINPETHEFELQVLKKSVKKEQEKFAVVPMEIDNATRIAYTHLTKAVAASLRGQQHTLLLSATVSEFDVREIGAVKSAPLYNAPHPIPQAMRPVYWLPLPEQFEDTFAKEAAEVIIRLYSERKVNTVVHCTYARQKAIYEALNAKLGSDVIISDANSYSKTSCVTKMGEGRAKIWVASGCSEGLNLINDLCRLQIIPELIFPNIGDALIDKRMRQKDGNAWYMWQSLRHLIQASGRSSRHASDFSETFIFDSRIPFYWTKWNEAGMIPEWFQIENA